jgi:hypothetical protein
MINRTQDEIDEWDREQLGGLRIVACAAVVGVITTIIFAVWIFRVLWGYV